MLVYMTQLEGALNAVQQEHPNMLSMGKFQKHLQDCHFDGLQKQLHDSMHYLYDSPRKMYPQLITVPWKTESEGSVLGQIGAVRRQGQNHKFRRD